MTDQLPDGLNGETVSARDAIQALPHRAGDPQKGRSGAGTGRLLSAPSLARRHTYKTNCASKETRAAGSR